MSTDDLVKLFTARARRRRVQALYTLSAEILRFSMLLMRLSAEILRFSMLLMRLSSADQKCGAPGGEKPAIVRTNLRNIAPEMIGSVLGVYNGKQFTPIEIKPEIIGHYLVEFSISYKPV